MYAGDKTCKETFDVLTSDSKSSLVDVRTTNEWSTIGTPDISQLGKNALFVEWQTFPTMQVNPNFAQMTHDKLEAQGISKDDPVFFLCRSGVRSKGAAAAMTAMGYTNAFNVSGGFEGDPDASGNRGAINGWVFDRLPWNKVTGNKEQHE